MCNNQQYNQDKSKVQDWIEVSTWLLDETLKSGISPGNLNVVIGKSGLGNSHYTQEMYIKQIKNYILSIRRQKIKKIIDLI